ncbi:MAG TPA: sigma-70 family RNA polymerase sigma factor [Opitutaceae bacterium]
MINESPELHSIAATRASLLRRIQDPQDHASWEEFYSVYKRLVFGFALRSGLSRADAEEVAQDVFTRVSQTIQDFESDPNRGTFRGWLRNLTRWRITDKARQRQRAERGRALPGIDEDRGDRTATIEQVPDTSAAADAMENAWEDEWERQVLDAALARLRRKSDPKHFQVFELSTVQGKNVSEIAQSLDMSRATVYVINHRLRKQLIAEVKKLKADLQ